jgi:hypothetical protein
MTLLCCELNNAAWEKGVETKKLLTLGEVPTTAKDKSAVRSGKAIKDSAFWHKARKHGCPHR